MENATKALLIAAAVLVAILVISLGLIVYNKSAETVNSAGDLSEYQIQQVNEKFTKYAGDNVSGSDVNALINTVLNHNLAQEEDNLCVQLDVGGTVRITRETIQATTPAKVATGARYNVVCNINPATKLIDHIVVTAR